MSHQNRFALLDSTARDTEYLMPTALDGSSTVVATGIENDAGPSVVDRDKSAEDVEGLQEHSPAGCGRVVPLSLTGDSDNERALVVRAGSDADAGGRVAVPSSGCPKRLRLVGRISQSTTVPEPPESLRDVEFDMTRCDSSSVELNAEDEGHNPLDDDSGSNTEVEAWWGASEEDEVGDSTDNEPEIEVVSQGVTYFGQVPLRPIFFFFFGQSYLGQVPLRPISFSTWGSPTQARPT